MSKHIWELAPKQAAELVESYLKNTNTTTRAEFIGSVDRIIGDYRDPVHATPAAELSPREQILRDQYPQDKDRQRLIMEMVQTCTTYGCGHWVKSHPAPLFECTKCDCKKLSPPHPQPEPTAESAEQQINNVLAKYDAESNGELGHVAGKYYLTAELLPILATAKAEGRRELAEQLKEQAFDFGYEDGRDVRLVKLDDIERLTKGDTPDEAI